MFFNSLTWVVSACFMISGQIYLFFTDKVDYSCIKQTISACFPAICTHKHFTDGVLWCNCKVSVPSSTFISISPSGAIGLLACDVSGNQLAEDGGVGGAAWLRPARVDLGSHPAFENEHQPNTNQMLIDVICKWAPAFWQYSTWKRQSFNIVCLLSEKWFQGVEARLNK